MADESARSFAKYLEVSIYSNQLFCRVLSCPHNIHRDHIRYFAYRNMAIRIFVDPINVCDVSLPPLRLRIDAWTQLRNKNDEYRDLQQIVTAYWDSVLRRIRFFNYDLLPTDRYEAGKTAMQEFEQRANEDRREFLDMLETAYEETQVNKPSAMNVVRHALVKRIVSWDNDFLG